MEKRCASRRGRCPIFMPCFKSGEHTGQEYQKEAVQSTPGPALAKICPKYHQQNTEQLLSLQSPTPKWSYLSSEKIVFHMWVTEASNPVSLSDYPTTSLGWFVSCSPKSWHNQKWLEARESCSVCPPMKETWLITVHPNDIKGYRFGTFISLDCRINLSKLLSHPVQLFGSSVPISHFSSPAFCSFCP